MNILFLCAKTNIQYTKIPSQNLERGFLYVLRLKTTNHPSIDVVGGEFIVGYCGIIGDVDAKTQALEILLQQNCLI